MKQPDPHEAVGYRKYLAEWIVWKKSTSAKFSLRQFASKAGFSSHSYLPKVIDGTRKLSEESAQQVSSALGLTGTDERFFLLLVRHDQCEDEVTREKLFAKLSAMRKVRFQRKLGAAQSNYYDQWFYPVLRQLAPWIQKNADPAKIGDMLDPPVSGAAVRQALSDLVEMGMLAERDGRWVAPDSIVSVDNLPRAVRIKGRHDILVKGMESLHRFGPEDRSTRCLLLGLSESGGGEVLEVMNDAARRCLEIAARDEHPEKIWQMVFQLFPVTRKIHQ